MRRLPVQQHTHRLPRLRPVPDDRDQLGPDEVPDLVLQRVPGPGPGRVVAGPSTRAAGGGGEERFPRRAAAPVLVPVGAAALSAVVHAAEDVCGGADVALSFLQLLQRRDLARAVHGEEVAHAVRHGVLVAHGRRRQLRHQRLEGAEALGADGVDHALEEAVAVAVEANLLGLPPFGDLQKAGPDDAAVVAVAGGRATAAGARGAGEAVVVEVVVEAALAHGEHPVERERAL